MYEIQTKTIIDGWTNVWTSDGKKEKFKTIHDAQFALYEFIYDMVTEYHDGNIEDVYNPHHFRIMEVK